MGLSMTAVKSHALPYALVDMSMPLAKLSNEGRRYRETVAESGSLDSFRLFILGSFSVVGNLELVLGQHSLTRKHFMGNKILGKLSYI